MTNKEMKSYYRQAKVEHHQVEDATIAVRKYGQGPPIIFIHGFIVHSYTWRKILPTLAENYSCYLIDLPGFGDSDWTPKTTFTFTAQTKRLIKLFEILKLKKITIIAQDTGATIARMIAVNNPNLIENLILLNTEIPYHRPPYIPMHQFLAKLPFSNIIFRSLLKIGSIVRSPLLLKQFYFDKTLLKQPENLEEYLTPLNSSSKMYGMLEYLKGIEWNEVDQLAKTHKSIKAKTLLLWGAHDQTFPITLAQKMSKQFTDCTFIAISNASLMPHEEQPETVIKHIAAFLKANPEAY